MFLNFPLLVLKVIDFTTGDMSELSRGLQQMEVLVFTYFSVVIILTMSQCLEVIKVAGVVFFNLPLDK